MSALYLHNIGTLCTMEARGDDELGRVRSAALLIEGDRIQSLGAKEDVSVPKGATRIDCQGNAVLPGLIDCHTHALFAGDRADEFALRARGASYAEIMAAGGGIRNTTRAVRAASEAQLAGALGARLSQMVRRGVTTVEVKSGYGLSVQDELKSLRAIAQANAKSAVEVVPTFLGAHAVPPEYEGRSSDYAKLCAQEMLPAVVEQGLAEACDVFIEGGAFSVAEGEVVLGAAKSLGLRLHVHAEQLSNSGGARLAAELGATSASHLEFATHDDIAALSRAGVIAEVLASAQVFLGMEQRIDGRAFLDAGLTVAVGTDLNPGSAHIYDLALAGGLAVTNAGLTAEAALLGITKNAARVLGREDRGVLSPGKRADVVVLDTDNPYRLLYDWGLNHIRDVVIGGAVQPLGASSAS